MAGQEETGMRRLIGYSASAILLILGAIFALASTYQPLRLVTSAFLFLAGFAILFYIRRTQPAQITQTLEVPAELKVKELRCPECSALLDVRQIKILDGIPSIECSYCGHTMEVTEEPKW